MTINRRPTRQPPAARLRAALTLGAILLSALLAPHTPAAAQTGSGFAGTYVLDTESGPIALTLHQAGASVTGTLQLGGNTYDLQGELDDIGIYGTVWTGQEALYFEAELQGQDLYMIMAQVDPSTGAPDPATAGEYLFRRSVAGAPATPPTGPLSATPPPANTPPSSSGPTGQLGTSGPPPGMATAQVGNRYEAGSVVGSADAGVAFVVPPAYYAGYHPQENVFMVISDTQPGLVVVEALSDLDLQSAIAQLSRSFQSGDAVVQPDGQPNVAGNVARARFTVYSSNGALPLYVMGVAGSANNVLIVAGLGAPQEQAQVRELVERIAASATVFEPTRASATAAANQFAGAQLGSGSSSSSTDRTSGTIDNASIELHLCPTGEYAYASSSRFSVSIYGDEGGGIHGSSSSSEEDHGRWSMVSGLLGPVMVLRSYQGGDDTFLALLQAGGMLYVDGLAVQVSRSARCG